MFAAKNILGNSELQEALKDLKVRTDVKVMRDVLLIAEKTDGNSDKFFQMFMESREILLKKLRLAIGKSSLYRMFSYRIDELNSILKLIHPSLYFVERRHVKKNSMLLTSYMLNPECRILENESFFLLQFQAENGENNYSEKIFRG